jgi:hypothetical protein
MMIFKKEAIEVYVDEGKSKNADEFYKIMSRAIQGTVIKKVIDRICLIITIATGTKITQIPMTAFLT